MKRINLGPRRTAILELIQQRYNSQSLVSSSPVQVPPEQDWRTKARAALQDVLRPEEIDWMEDDQNLDDERYIQRVLDDATSKLTRFVFFDIGLPEWLTLSYTGDRNQLTGVWT